MFRVIVEFKNDERILSLKEKICKQFYLIGCVSEIISRNSIKQRLKDKLYSINTRNVIFKVVIFLPNFCITAILFLISLCRFISFFRLILTKENYSSVSSEICCRYSFSSLYSVTYGSTYLPILTRIYFCCYKCFLPTGSFRIE